MEEENQPQETEVQEAEPVGEEEPQPVEQPETEELGAEEKPQEREAEPPPPRTYSQEEWSKRESELNKQSEELRRQLAQTSMRVEVAEVAKAEAEARISDQKEVDEGAITQLEATKRAEVRESQRKSERESQNQQQAMRQMAQQTEQYGRLLAAQDFGKQYELTQEQVTELLTDQEIKTPGDMKAKAADLALERERGKAKPVEPQKFDSGISGTHGKTLEGKSPMELSQMAYSTDETRRRQKKK